MKNRNYALITGAGEGLGKSIALELARNNWNLILVALPGPQVSHLSGMLRRNYDIDVQTAETDLSEEANCNALLGQFGHLPISLLVNNAGMGGTIAFEEADPQYFCSQIRINVLAITLLTRLFLPVLQKNEPANIINISSLSCFFALPYKQVYAATKAFVFSFSRSLYKELRGTGIGVTVVCPGGMNTNPSVTYKNQQASWIARQSLMRIEEVAPVIIKEALQGKFLVVPGKMNRLFLLLDKIFPAFLKDLINRAQMSKLRRGWQQAV